jgi:hypothetical protein
MLMLLMPPACVRWPLPPTHTTLPGNASAVLELCDTKAADAAGRALRSNTYGFVWCHLAELSEFMLRRCAATRAAADAERMASRARAAVDARSDPTADHPQQQQGGQQQDPLEVAAEAEAAAAAAVAAVHERHGVAALRSRLAALDREVGTMLAALQPNGLLLVVGGQGDMYELRRREEAKIRRRQGLEDPAWGTADEEQHCLLIEQEMRGVVFCAVKR